MEQIFDIVISKSDIDIIIAALQREKTSDAMFLIDMFKSVETDVINDFTE